MPRTIATMLKGEAASPRALVAPAFKPGKAVIISRGSHIIDPALGEVRGNWTWTVSTDAADYRGGVYETRYAARKAMRAFCRIGGERKTVYCPPRPSTFVNAPGSINIFDAALAAHRAKHGA